MNKKEEARQLSETIGSIGINIGGKLEGGAAKRVMAYYNALAKMRASKKENDKDGD